MSSTRTISLWGRTCKAQLIMLNKPLEDVAREVGLTKTYVSAVINERVVAPDETKDKISRALQVDPSLRKVV